MMKVDLLPRCDEPDGDTSYDCGAPAVAHVADSSGELADAYMCELHFKEHLWNECNRATSFTSSERIKLRVRNWGA